MAVALILGSFAPELPIDCGGSRRPAAEDFIRSAPASILLFAPLLIPYSQIGARAPWAACWFALAVAATVLVIAGLKVCYHYYVGESEDRGEALFLISLSIVVSAITPLAVLAARKMG